MNCLAAVFYEPGLPLELESVATPVLQSGELLVQVDCCTICGSDVRTVRGDRPVDGPTVLGHEILGRVAALPTHNPPCDATGNPLSVDARVTWSVMAACHECFYCRAGLPQKCARLFKYGHQPFDSSHPLSGGLAEQCVIVPTTTIVRIPDELPDIVACPASCATATAVAALRTAGGCVGKCVLIHGAGMLGLTATALAHDGRAHSVIVSDVLPERCELALKFGATRAHAAADLASLRQAIDEATSGRGVDTVIDMSGSPIAIENSFDQLRTGGQLILVGSVFPGRDVPLSPERVIRQMLRIDGVHNYVPADLVEAVDFLQRKQGQFPFAELVGAEFRLADVNEAVRFAQSGRVARVAVRP